MKNTEDSGEYVSIMVENPTQGLSTMDDRTDAYQSYLESQADAEEFLPLCCQDQQIYQKTADMKVKLKANVPHQLFFMTCFAALVIP